MKNQDRSNRFEFQQARGPHGVGVRVIEHFDFSRTFSSKNDPLGRPNRKERARPLQTLVWYPTQAPSEIVMRVRDYLALWASETDFECAALPYEAEQWSQALAPALDDKLWAVRDAPDAAGPFPLVIYAPSFSSRAWENADLCEYLASYGYVVLAVPSLGTRTRAMTMDIAGLRAQAQDISFLIGFARSLPQVDLERLAVVGFSWGGLANIFAADVDDRIGALVALDGSLRYWPSLVQAAGIKAGSISVPLLSISQGEWTLEDHDRFVDPAQFEGPNVLNAWAGELVNIQMLGMTHRQFTSMGQRNEDYWRDFADPDFLDRQKADYDRADAAIGYAWMCRYVREFLDHSLNNAATAREFLSRTPHENGAPKHFMSFKTAKAKPARPTLEALRDRLAAEGFDCLAGLDASRDVNRSSIAALGDPATLEWVEDLLRIGADEPAQLLLRAIYQHGVQSARQLTIASKLFVRCGDEVAAREALEKAAILNPFDPAIRHGLTLLS